MAALVERYDRTWSRFRDDSLVSRIAREPGSWALPAEAGPLLALYRRLYELSDGRVSPLVGRALETLGYDPAYSLHPAGPAGPAPRWEDALAWDGARLDTPAPVLLDVGAAGKGQLVDLVAELLADRGVRGATVDGGGDVRHHGERDLRIALEHPADPGRAIGVLELPAGAGFAASATNRRAWGAGLHHVLDATTGRPVTRYVASWVVAEDAMTADGFATALLLLPRAVADALREARWARMRADGRVEVGPGFPAELFLRPGPDKE